MNFIVAIDENWNIGYKGGLLERIPADMKQFREKTTGKVIVVGRKTLESFPGVRPLPNRTNIVLTRQEGFTCEGAIVCHSYDELFRELGKYNDDDIFIAGGGEVYSVMIPYCSMGYITKIHKVYKADTYIPNLDNSGNWEVVSRDGPYHYRDDIYYSYMMYKNIAPKIFMPQE